MEKKLLIIVVTLISLVFTSCAGFPKETLKLSNGDTKQEVFKYYGEPDNTQFKGKYEALEYCIQGTSFGRSSYRTIWMYDGKVIGMNSYTKRGSCEFDYIEWKKAPDYTLEVRDR